MDRITIQDLKKAAAGIAAAYGVDVSSACKIVGYYNAGAHKDLQTVSALVAGDLSAVPAAAAALGVALQGVYTVKDQEKKNAVQRSENRKRKAEKTTAARRDLQEKEKKTRKAAAHDLGGVAVPVEIVEQTPAGVLPDNVPALVMDVISAYCEQNNISDLSKERQPRWGAACYMVGVSVFKPSKILHDIEREKTHGGTVYDVGRVSALSDLWGVLCQNFCKAPLIDDFARFAGLSDTWVYGSNLTDGLTPARALLLQKLKRLQENGLSALIVDGRQNPTGALAALNHWHGWTQTREIIHTSGAGSVSAPSLPVFDGSSGFLSDLGEEKPAKSD